MEWIIIILGIIGTVCLYYTFPQKWLKILISGYGLGLFFEASMDPLFTYHNQLRDRHCIGKSDINFVFPLGWMEVCGITAFIAEKILLMHSVWEYILICFIIGNLNEFLFYKFHFWVYHYDRPMIGRFNPFRPKITAFGVPVQVIIGYCNVGIMAYALCNILH